VTISSVGEVEPYAKDGPNSTLLVPTSSVVQVMLVEVALLVAWTFEMAR
jgi:hypothetical protein